MNCDINLLFLFKACTEMVMPLCANGKDDMFYPFDVRHFLLYYKTAICN